MPGFANVLDLKAGGDETFIGRPALEGGNRVYGGYTLSQALWAALQTVPSDWICHTWHTQFLRPASPDQGLDHAVEITSNGRNFAVRRVTVRQGGKVVATATGSFQRHSEGMEYQGPTLCAVPGPEDFEPESVRYGRVYDSLVAQGLPAQQLPDGIDGRLTEPQDFLSPKVRGGAHPMWLRAIDPIPETAHAQQTALAWCSDYNFNEPVLRPHGYSWIKPTSAGIVTLDHSIWFHRRTDMADWHLCDGEVLTTSGGRGFVQAKLYDRQGALVASVAQQARFAPEKTAISP